MMNDSHEHLVDLLSAEVLVLIYWSCLGLGSSGLLGISSQNLFSLLRRCWIDKTEQPFT